MIAPGRVRRLDGACFTVRLDGVGAELVAGVDLVTASPDLVNPFAVVGGVDQVLDVDGGVELVGRLDAVDGAAAVRRVRGLLAGRRVSRFAVEGRCLRLLHPHLSTLRDPFGALLSGVDAVGVGG
ncbi:hypothetical protein ICV35_26770 [Rhodococcus ruber]|uniref:hypothetical protein n=1 Tax=Rhodococcus ruber TaxID=1830 RepID=UPI0017807DF1|nr:hypothetical protein [Rhodococcus ruber]MBD8057244.1 hypothetical protein [Rhodococcus ruber]